jgi:hypothetical protein
MNPFHYALEIASKRSITIERAIELWEKYDLPEELGDAYQEWTSNTADV